MKIVDKRNSFSDNTFEAWCESEKLHIEITDSTWKKGEVTATLVSDDSNLIVICPFSELSIAKCGSGKTPEEAIKRLKDILWNNVLRRRKKGWFMFGWVGPIFKVPYL